MKRPVRTFGLVLGWVLVALSGLLGLAILASLVYSHVIFVEARLVALAIPGALAWVGFLLVLLCRRKDTDT